MVFLDYFEILAVVTISSPTYQLRVFLQFREEVTLQIEHVMTTLVM